jgi:hypothetical protein
LSTDARPPLRPWRWVFAAVGIYDLVLGAGFFLLYRPLFDLLDIELPPSTAYIHLAATLIAVQGVSYLLAARRPVRNVDIIRVGVLYKLTYAGLALYYTVAGGAPHALFLWFGVVDAVTVVAFAAYLRLVRPAYA